MACTLHINFLYCNHAHFYNNLIKRETWQWLWIAITTNIGESSCRIGQVLMKQRIFHHYLGTISEQCYNSLTHINILTRTRVPVSVQDDRSSLMTTMHCENMYCTIMLFSVTTVRSSGKKYSIECLCSSASK